MFSYDCGLAVYKVYKSVGYLFINFYKLFKECVLKIVSGFIYTFYTKFLHILSATIYLHPTSYKSGFYTLSTNLVTKTNLNNLTIVRNIYGN